MNAFSRGSLFPHLFMTSTLQTTKMYHTVQRLQKKPKCLSNKKATSFMGIKVSNTKYIYIVEGKDEEEITTLLFPPSTSVLLPITTNGKFSGSDGLACKKIMFDQYVLNLFIYMIGSISNDMRNKNLFFIRNIKPWGLCSTEVVQNNMRSRVTFGSMSSIISY